MEDICKKILFLSSFQRKLKECPLIEVNKFLGLQDNAKLMQQDEILFSEMFREVGILQHLTNPIDKIKTFLFLYIDNLKFNGYCLAGGAPSWAIHSDQVYVNMDLDFFPVVGECVGNNWKDEKFNKAKKIYDDFYLEMMTLKEKLGPHYDLLIWQSDNCTTFSFYHDFKKLAYNDRNVKCDYCQGEEKYISSFKLSFIHRAYNTPEQILQGFDLAASQVLYDGFQFKMTYAAYLSLFYSIVPIDVSSASDSFYSRLYKYSSNKNYSLVFNGLDIDKFRNEKKRCQNNGPSFRIEFPKGSYIWQNFHEETYVHLCLGYGNNHKDTKVDPGSMTKESDYGDAGEYTMALTENFNFCGLKHFLLTGRVLKRKWSTDGTFNAADIEKALREICSFKTNTDAFLIGQLFPKIFGEDTNDAILAFACRDSEKFNILFDKYLSLLLQRYKTAIIEQDLSFLVDEPGMQIRRSFNPVDLTARGFYGKYYNGFHCTMDWPAKCQILIAYRKERTGKNDQCCLFWLDMNLIKFIFYWLDYIWMKEIMIEVEELKEK